MSDTNGTVRRFQVEAIEGKVMDNIASYDPKTGFEYKTEKKDFGFMVYFPAGHSIRVANEAELTRLGFHRQPGLVNMSDGEIVEPDSDEIDNSPKAVVQRSMKGRRDPKVLPPDEDTEE